MADIVVRSALHEGDNDDDDDSDIKAPPLQ